MPTKIYIIMSNSVNILLRPVLGAVPATDSVSLKMEQLCHGCRLVIMHLAFVPLGAVTVSRKQLRNAHQIPSL